MGSPAHGVHSIPQKRASWRPHLSKSAGGIMIVVGSKLASPGPRPSASRRCLSHRQRALPVSAASASHRVRQLVRICMHACGRSCCGIRRSERGPAAGSCQQRGRTSLPGGLQTTCWNASLREGAAPLSEPLCRAGCSGVPATTRNTLSSGPGPAGAARAGASCIPTTVQQPSPASGVNGWQRGAMLDAGTAFSSAAAPPSPALPPQGSAVGSGSGAPWALWARHLAIVSCSVACVSFCLPSTGPACVTATLPPYLPCLAAPPAARGGRTPRCCSAGLPLGAAGVGREPEAGGGAKLKAGGRQPPAPR